MYTALKDKWHLGDASILHEGAQLTDLDSCGHMEKAQGSAMMKHTGNIRAQNPYFKIHSPLVSLPLRVNTPSSCISFR